MRRWEWFGHAALLLTLAGLLACLYRLPIADAPAALAAARGLAAAAVGLGAALALGAWRRHGQQGEAEQRLKAFLDHGPMNPYIKDADGTVLWVGQRMRDNFPKSPRWVGQQAMAGIPAELTRRLNAQIPAILAGDEARSDEVDVPQADGSLHRMLVVRFPMVQGGRRLMGGYSMDIQDMVDARAAQEAYARELEAANKELQNFASVAAHDLQEPLRKIQAFGERLELALTAEASAQARQDLARILSASRRMRALIEALLSYSRVTSQARPFQPVDLGACLSEAWSDLELQAESCGGALDAADLPSAQADPTQMRQLFQNLLSNALKYRRQGVAPRIQVAARTEGQWLELSFRDNGIGFDPAYREKVFELFQRLHGRDEYEGTGLGLAICRKIAERHGGSLQADGQPGAGATFTLRLPHPTPYEGAPA